MNQQQWTAPIGEGYGAPVFVDRKFGRPIDPTLDSCCQREIESNRQYNAVQRTLRRHDRVALAERLRRNAVFMADGAFQGCRCSFDPNQDGGEYGALREFKSKIYNEGLLTQEQESEHEYVERKDDAHSFSNQDSDDDSEFDYLLDQVDAPGASELATELEARRREELESTLLIGEALAHHGWGVHRQIGPARVWAACGLGTPEECAVLLHLFDPDRTASAHLDYLFETIYAPKFRGTRFLRTPGRPALAVHGAALNHIMQGTNLRAEHDLPALLAIRNGQVVALCRNFEGLVCDNDNQIQESALQHWLDMTNILHFDIPSIEDLCRIRPEEDALIASGILGKDAAKLHSDSSMSTAQRALAELKNRGMKSNIDDLPTFFRCGVPGCEKTYKHEHVGIQTEEQSGLVVKLDVDGNTITPVL